MSKTVQYVHSISLLVEEAVDCRCTAVMYTRHTTSGPLCQSGIPQHVHDICSVRLSAVFRLQPCKFE